ncbi:hypothetical protein ONA02_06890 [Mycoplasmopsis felis]|uniref:hypothetical protein n=1 Tax=Mycoplasmopsis felis TaxID=33923 RepID=UPI0022854724|nr:hypothetical protein [Mycoplasmopsis felis]WAM02269.1 hypothetical protein ONA02_06890 [Mycoplasmopsis felis]
MINKTTHKTIKTINPIIPPELSYKLEYTPIENASPIPVILALLIALKIASSLFGSLKLVFSKNDFKNNKTNIFSKEVSPETNNEVILKIMKFKTKIKPLIINNKPTPFIAIKNALLIISLLSLEFPLTVNLITVIINIISKLLWKQLRNDIKQKEHLKNFHFEM